MYQALWRFADKGGGDTSSPYVMHLIPFNLYAKKGNIQEALATQYVAENTTIPVPTMLDAIELGPEKGGFLLMTGVKGREYGPTGITLDEMSEGQRTVFTETLRGWFEQLRCLPPPDDHTISGFTGMGLMSYRINHFYLSGPFQSQDQFHAQRFCQPFEPYDDALRAALEIRAKKQYRICFTHGDIRPHNILVDENLRPCALIDWECAAWMPEYWEYTQTVYLRERYIGWKKVFTDIFPDYNAELTVERAVWEHYTPP
ncbi:hypothetical protein C0991_006670 [Blastosporella zonata]|nr:hypothetical protein C0991_006670 [Blastosporella zonata]